MEKHIWSALNHLQLGRYAEYYAKMEFALHGIHVFTAEVDDIGIDFIIKIKNQYFDIQVKSSRNNNYIFFQKDKFQLRLKLFAAIVLFHDKEKPNIFLVPSLDWNNPNSLLSSRDYQGKKSKPEWGFNTTDKNKDILSQYQFDNVLDKMLAGFYDFM
jgi:hypothetical protein